MGHLNGILARVGGNLNKKFQKSQMPGGGMLKLRFDRYISVPLLIICAIFLPLNPSTTTVYAQSAFYRACVLVSVCSLHFTPGPQSAVHSLRLTLTE